MSEEKSLNERLDSIGKMLSGIEKQLSEVILARGNYPNKSNQFISLSYARIRADYSINTIMKN